MIEEHEATKKNQKMSKMAIWKIMPAKTTRELSAEQGYTIHYTYNEQ